MKFKVLLASAAIAAELTAPGAVSATVYTYEITDFNPTSMGAVTGYIQLNVTKGQSTGGSVILAGGTLPHGWTDFSLVTTNNYCGGTCTGWRAGDGTDWYGGDTNFPIDANGLIFNSGSMGKGYVFGLYSEFGVGAPYQAALFGPGGPNNYYTYNDGLTLTAVPEPATWATILTGFAALGFAGYRKTRMDAA